MTNRNAKSIDGFVSIVEDGDILSLLLLVACLASIGSRVIQSRPDLAGWSRRLSLVVLLSYTGFRWVTLTPNSPGEMISILLRGSLAAVLVMTLSWILLPVVTVIWTETIWRMATSMGILASRALRRQRELKTEKELVAFKRPPLIATPTAEQLRLKQEEEVRIRIAREAAEAAARRREDTRLRCELFYQQYARQLATSFPRKRFDQFVEKYLSDNSSPDEVEQREQMLKQMMLDSLGTSAPVKFTSMAELAAYYQARREEIDRLPHDEEVKDTYRIQLNKQEDEALRRMLKP